MKRNPHIIVQQVCPMKKTDDGKYEVQAAIVRHKGLIARFCVEYPTKRHARWAQSWRYLTDEQAAILRRKNP